MKTKTIYFFLCIWAVLQVFDWITTWIADLCGIMEQNPLMYAVIASYGFVGLALVKAASILIYGGCCYFALHENAAHKAFLGMSLFVVVFYLCIVGGNALTIVRTI